MKLLFKCIFLVPISLFSVLVFCFADDDCILATAPVSSFSWSAFSGVLPYSNLTLAYDHLLSYCCTKNLFPEWIVDCSKASPSVFLESPYLFDHIIDVWFRHLDVTSAYSWQVVDSWAQAWYDFLHLSGTKAMTPLMVQAQYKKFWSLNQVPLLQDEGGDILNYLPLYTGFSLWDKYYNLCFVLKNWYEKILQPDSDKWPIIIWDQYTESSFYNKCMNLAEEKVGQELSFTQTSMLERSTNTLQTTIESYIITNFVQDRLSSLLDKLKSIVQLFIQVVAQAPLSKRCSN